VTTPRIPAQLGLQLGGVVLPSVDHTFQALLAPLKAGAAHHLPDARQQGREHRGARLGPQLGATREEQDRSDEQVPDHQQDRRDEQPEVHSFDSREVLGVNAGDDSADLSTHEQEDAVLDHELHGAPVQPLRDA
jgi:hypothetical protein